MYGVITLSVEVFNYTLVVLERGVRKTVWREGQLYAGC